MCDRFFLFTPANEIASALGTDLAGSPPALAPRYNLSCPQTICIVIDRPGAGGQPRGREIRLVRWGLIPSWARDWDVSRRTATFPAFQPTERPAFVEGLRYRRCLVPADGYFDWQHDGESDHPVCVRVCNPKTGQPGLFAMAGIWATWEPPDDAVDREPVDSCAILTVPACPGTPNPQGEMPGIIPSELWSEWLDPMQNNTAAALRCLRPPEESSLLVYKVSRAVNNPRNDSPMLIEPVPELKLPRTGRAS